MFQHMVEDDDVKMRIGKGQAGAGDALERQIGLKLAVIAVSRRDFRAATGEIGTENARAGAKIEQGLAGKRRAQQRFDLARFGQALGHVGCGIALQFHGPICRGWFALGNHWLRPIR